MGPLVSLLRQRRKPKSKSLCSHLINLGSRLTYTLPLLHSLPAYCFSNNKIANNNNIDGKADDDEVMGEIAYNKKTKRLRDKLNQQ